MRYFILISILLASCQAPSDTGDYDSFGMQISAENTSSLADWSQQLAVGDTASAKISGTIDQVCQSKGCWMTLKTEDGQKVRVTFKDYGFFMPKDASGREVVLEGIGVLTELDLETARHFAEDADKPFDETSDRSEISIVASGVLIKKPAQL